MIFLQRKLKDQTSGIQVFWFLLVTRPSVQYPLVITALFITYSCEMCAYHRSRGIWTASSPGVGHSVVQCILREGTLHQHVHVQSSLHLRVL